MSFVVESIRGDMVSCFLNRWRVLSLANPQPFSPVGFFTNRDYSEIVSGGVMLLREMAFYLYLTDGPLTKAAPDLVCAQISSWLP